MEAQQLLPDRNDFPSFPFAPYPIQQEFMSELYKACSCGQLGLFESPTGTGKSLSILCAVLHWLQDHRAATAAAAAAAATPPGATSGCSTARTPPELSHAAQQRQQSREGPLQGSEADADHQLPDWMVAATASQTAAPAEAVQHCRKSLQIRGKRLPAAACRRLAASGTSAPGKENVGSSREAGQDEEEQEFLPARDALAAKKRGRASDLSSSSSSSSGDEGDDMGRSAGLKRTGLELQLARPQVIIGSRTHSQLSQLLGELNKTGFAGEFTVVPVGSRKLLCVNEEVRRLGSAWRMNEACKEMQRPTSQAAGKGGKKRRGRRHSGCAYLKGVPAAAQTAFAKDILAKPVDIEELARRGQQKAVCPYYAARNALPHADIILLPYQLLLCPSSRKSLGMDVSGSVVILDEAHNVLRAMEDLGSAAVSQCVLQAAIQQVESYLTRFEDLLSAANAHVLQRLRQVLVHLQDGVERYVAGRMPRRSDSTSSPGAAEGGPCAFGAMGLNDLLFLCGLQGVNLAALVQSLEGSNMLHRVAGYATRLSLAADSAAPTGAAGGGGAPHAEGKPPPRKPPADARAPALDMPVMHVLNTVMKLLACLMDEDPNGRILLLKEPDSDQHAADAIGSSSPQPEASAGKAAQGTSPSRSRPGYCIKYVLVNPAPAMAQLADKARALVLASGTLSPMNTLIDMLFPSPAQRARVRCFTCNHIISPDRLLALPICSGPSGRSLDLRHPARSRPDTMDEVGRVLLNLASIVPDGLVIFVSSFNYLSQLLARWQASGTLQALQRKKLVLQEPGSAGQVEGVLQQYNRVLQQHQQPAEEAAVRPAGAILLCVAGGKMSEGINFSDGMGRCVVMVGLPYPNPSDPEMCERMRLLDSRAPTPSSSCSQTDTPGAGYLSELCMKTLNQCIGRSIRHRNDWSSIVLLDARWTRHVAGAGESKLIKMLPAWIRGSLEMPLPLGTFGPAFARLARFFRHQRQS